MNISFALTPKDLHFFYRYHYWSSPGRKWYRIKRIGGYWLILLLLLLFIYMRDDAITNWNIFIPGVLGLGIIASVLIRFLVLNWIKRYVNKLLRENQHQNLTGERTIYLTTDGVRVQTSLSEGMFNYAIILRLEETHDYFLIYVNSAAAIVVPKHAFAHENEIFLFKQLLTRDNIVQTPEA